MDYVIFQYVLDIQRTIHTSLQVVVMNEYQPISEAHTVSIDPKSVFDFGSDTMSITSTAASASASTDIFTDTANVDNNIESNSGYIYPRLPHSLSFDFEFEPHSSSFDPEQNATDNLLFNHIRDLCLWAKIVVTSLRVDIRAINNINRLFQNGCVNVTLFKNINLLLFVAARRLGTCDIQGFDWCVNEIQKIVRTRIYV